MRSQRLPTAFAFAAAHPTCRTSSHTASIAAACSAFDGLVARSLKSELAVAPGIGTIALASGESAVDTATCVCLQPHSGGFTFNPSGEAAGHKHGRRV